MRYPILLLCAVSAAMIACDSSDSSTKSACVKGETRICVGPGQCEGAQSCNADGNGWSTCDCGTNGQGIGGKDAASAGSGGDAVSGGASSTSPSGGGTAAAGVTSTASSSGGALASAGASSTVASSGGALAAAGASAAAAAGTKSSAGSVSANAGKAGSTSLSSGGKTTAAAGTSSVSVAGAAGNIGAAGAASCVGPGDNLCWYTLTSTDWPPKACTQCSANWATLDETQAHVIAASVGSSTAGMGFSFGSPAAVTDLSVYGSMAVAADIPVGQAFTVNIATLDGRQSCSWAETGKGAGQQYEVPLQLPDSCWPKCAFDLKSAFVNFETPWAAPGTVDLRVTDVGFKPLTGAAQTVATSSAGPNAWCWYTWQNPSTTAAWVVPPSTASVRAYLTTSSTTANSGMGFALPVTDLTRFDRILISVTTTGQFEFGVARADSTAGCFSAFTGDGTRQIYTFDFTKCSKWTNPATAAAFSFTTVSNVNLSTRWGITGSLDIEVVPDVLFCLGTQCTNNPLP